MRKLDEVVRLLRAQIILSNEALEKLKALKKILQDAHQGVNVMTAVQALEPVLLELGKLEKQKQAFLAKEKASMMRAYIARLPQSEEREIVVHLFHRVQEFEETLSREITAARLLLERAKKYVDFHINVMTKTVASDIYTQGAAESEERRGIKMFDSSV